MYFTKSMPTDPKDMHQLTSTTWSPTQKLVFSALMAALAAILQAAGSLIPVIGLLISPFTTMPILLAVIVSMRYGIFSYFLTILLLLLLEPSELFIFPFTTGLLGIALGWGFLKLQKRLGILLISGCVLFIGICIPLYVLAFPVFGPSHQHLLI